MAHGSEATDILSGQSSVHISVITITVWRAMALPLRLPVRMPSLCEHLLIRCKAYACMHSVSIWLIRKQYFSRVRNQAQANKMPCQCA